MGKRDAASEISTHAPPRYGTDLIRFSVLFIQAMKNEKSQMTNGKCLSFW